MPLLDWVWTTVLNWEVNSFVVTWLGVGTTTRTLKSEWSTEWILMIRVKCWRSSKIVWKLTLICNIQILKSLPVSGSSLEGIFQRSTCRIATNRCMTLEAINGHARMLDEVQLVLFCLWTGTRFCLVIGTVWSGLIQTREIAPSVFRIQDKLCVIVNSLNNAVYIQSQKTYLPKIEAFQISI